MTGCLRCNRADVHASYITGPFARQHLPQYPCLFRTKACCVSLGRHCRLICDVGAKGFTTRIVADARQIIRRVGVFPDGGNLSDDVHLTEEIDRDTVPCQEVGP